MRREPPAWWYRDALSWQAAALSPFAALVDAAATMREGRVTPYRADLPVICVGNFTVGGAGKTPLALAVAGLLRDMGHRPAFLTRGYGGSAHGPLWVDPAASSTLVGDEPLLLARAAPTMLARDRAAGAKAITAGAAGPPTVIVMDDGLQNPSLIKDVRLVVVDGALGFGNRRVLPAGPLRRSLAAQRPLADAMVVIGAPRAELGPDLASFRCPILTAHLAPVDAAWLAGAPVLAFAGIGRPGKFFDTLTVARAKVVERPFPDHHPYSDADCAGLLAAARTGGLQLVTTEKDFARLGHQGAAGELRQATRVLRVELVFDGGGSAALAGIVRGLARPRHTRAGP
jgi:tetraacyldisaccharide 4'-kinase